MPATEPQTIQEQNKHLLVRWFDEVWNQGRRETIPELLAADCVLYDGSNVLRGPDEFARFYDGLRAEFSNFRITTVVALAEDDLVSLRWAVECRHTATNKPVQLTGMSIVRVKDCQFVEGWQNWDAAGLAAQLAS